jgi:hypothetical protein
MLARDNMTSHVAEFEKLHSFFFSSPLQRLPSTFVEHTTLVATPIYLPFTVCDNSWERHTQLGTPAHLALDAL